MRFAMEKRNILIACTGSVAAIKLGEIIQILQNNDQFKFEVRKNRIFLSFDLWI